MLNSRLLNQTLLAKFPTDGAYIFRSNVSWIDEFHIKNEMPWFWKFAHYGDTIDMKACKAFEIAWCIQESIDASSVRLISMSINAT